MFFLESAMDVVYAISVMQKGIMAGNLEEVRGSIKKGVKVDGMAGDAPYIWIAANQKHWNIVEFFLNEGANPNVVNRFGVSLLQQIVKSADLEMVKFVIDKMLISKISLNKQDLIDGDTPLITVIKNNECGNKDNIIDYLLSLDAINPMSRDDDWKTTLHHAAIKGDKETFKKLLVAGVPIDMCDRNGKTAVDYIEDEVWKAEMPLIEKVVNEEIKKNVIIEEKNAEVLFKEDDIIMVKQTSLSSIKKRR